MEKMLLMILLDQEVEEIIKDIQAPRTSGFEKCIDPKIWCWVLLVAVYYAYKKSGIKGIGDLIYKLKNYKAFRIGFVSFHILIVLMLVAFYHGFIPFQR